MTDIVRPGTPFPHTTILEHHQSSSTYHAMSSPSSTATGSYFPHSLHFSPRALPARTPPSLLNRSASSGSSSSSSYRPQHARRASATPSLVFDRRGSSTSMSASEQSSPASPRLLTPPVEVSTPYDDYEQTPSVLELPSPITRKALALPPPEYNWTEKAFTPETSFDLSSTVWEVTQKSEDVMKPKRPSFTRRDTPRPTTTSLSTLGMTVTEQKRERGKRLTSMVDGGAWIIVE